MEFKDSGLCGAILDTKEAKEWWRADEFGDSTGYYHPRALIQPYANKFMKAYQGQLSLNDEWTEIMLNVLLREKSLHSDEWKKARQDEILLKELKEIYQMK